MLRAAEAPASDAASAARARSLLIAGLLLSGLALRPQITEMAPLLPEIRGEFGLSFAEAGLLTTIPVVCMGLFALPAARLYTTAGPRASLAAALCLVVAGGALRAWSPDAGWLLAFTVVSGIGAGLAGGLLPAIVRQGAPAKPALATGIYSLGINGGAGIAAALAVPLAVALEGWRRAFGVLAAAGTVSIAAWLILSRDNIPRSEAGPGPVIVAWRRPEAWSLGIVFGLQALCFFGLNAWLANTYVERGWTVIRSGWLVATLNFVTLPSSLLVGLIGDRVSRRAYLVLASVMLFCGISGAVLVPSAGWLWTVIAGVACGALFPLILTLSVEIAASPKEAGAIAGLALAVGYLIAGLGPFVLGAARDAAGSFASGFYLLIAVSLLLVGACLVLARRHAVARGSRATRPAR